jgi:hypothetical protein
MDVARRVIAGSLAVALTVCGWWYARGAHDGSPTKESAPSSPSIPAAVSSAAPERREKPKGSSDTAAPRGQETATVATIPGSELDMRTLAECHRDLLVKQLVQRAGDCDRIPPDDVVSQNFCRSQEVAMAKELQRVTAASASCPPELGLARSFYDATKARALRGDIAAQRCFIQGYFEPSNEHSTDPGLGDERRKEYAAIARRFIDEALERGDWSVVRWLSRTKLYPPDGLLNEAYGFGIDHLDAAYQMNFLLMLGHQPGAGDDARRLVEYWKSSRLVPADDIAAGELWAHDMFDRHFDASQEGANVTASDFCARG